MNPCGKWRGGRGCVLNSFRWTSLLTPPRLIPRDKLAEPACLRITSQRYTASYAQRNRTTPALPPFLLAPPKIGNLLSLSPSFSRPSPQKSPSVHPSFSFSFINQLIPLLFSIAQKRGAFPSPGKGGLFDSRRRGECACVRVMDKR